MSTSPLFSMTGFGRAEQSAGDWHVIAEVKSLNGKQLELNLKLPPLLKTREFEVRGLIANALLRGSIDCTITLRQNGATKPVELNTDLLRAYYRSVKTVSDELGLDTTNILEALLRLPEVVMPVTELVDDQGWQLVTDTLQQALVQLNTHRLNEGAILQTDLKERILAILAHNEAVSGLAAQRPDYVRENLRKKIEEQLGKENYDRNRLEQEIIFYIEKMDISEELVRLNNHCRYFLELLDHEETGKGKKLGFLLQEIGREINTTGAKAYDATMQKLVVAMKDELEKAKEQILNVL
ncbi:MAG: YicC family protein [Chitinophagaceae bacterium]|nr:YicC family protein [Chitinophagaceae bacterium]